MKIKNPVAKFMGRVNKNSVHKPKKDYIRKAKHKGKSHEETFRL